VRAVADSLPGWHARPAVLDRLPAGRHAVIEASAGTGKTFTLEHLVVELVLVEGVPIEEILVVTFTEKATREMRERVRRKLREVADAAPRPDDAEGPGWTVDAEGRRRLQDALASFDRAPISTIHAFCQRLLSEHAFACARLLEQTAVEPRHAFREAFRQELRVALAPSDPLGPVLTRVLLHLGGENLEDVLYRWAQERGEPALAYEPARVEELLRRLPGQDDLAGGGLWLRLLEAGLQRTPKKTVPALLRKLAPAIDALREGEASLYDTLLRFWDWARERGTKSLTALPYLRKYLPAAAQRERNLEGLARTVDALADLAGDPLVVLVFELLPRVVDRLARQKSALGQFDFDDMLVLVRDALDPAGGPLAASLRALLRRRYRVALVDEFQDTDEVQWTIFRRLFFDDTDAHRLVLIGDPKQAIYGFRNADVHTYHTARAEVLADGGVSAPLTANFRTRASLLEGVDRILREGFFTGVNAYPGPPECGRPELRALRDGVDAPAITLLHLVGRDGPLRFDEARRALAARIAEEVKRILAGDLRVDRGDGPKPVSAADIHVLCRTGAEARQVGEALRDAAVPHAFYKQEGLFQTAIARDVLDVLLALGDPRSSALRRAAWRTPFFAVPLERLGDLDDLPPEHPLVDDLYRMARLAEDGRWETLFAELLDGSGFIRRELFWGGSERRLTDAQHVFELLLAEVHQGLRSLPQLTRRLSGFISGRERPVGEDGNVHRLESERRAVQLLTMHKAKGLEAEVVFVVGGLGLSRPDPSRPQVFHDAEGRRRVWIGRPPADVEAIRRAEQRQEDERLLYVALTRARSRLFLPYLGPPPPEQQEEEATYELAPSKAPMTRRRSSPCGTR
jgi:exodeoxyribonuclease V beta subunit